ncbi:MAG: tetratricopeptide repeat protein, partial [Deltaproteobacteria bacterium]
SMATLFSLLALYSYVKARLAEKGFTRAWLFGAAALFAGMALLSKENSGMLPVIIAGYEFYFLPRSQKGKTNNRKAFIFYTVALLVFIGICLLFLGSNPIHSILAKFSSREFTLGQRLLTETRVVFHYLSLLILPLPSRLNLAYDYPLSTGLLAPPQTLLAILGLGTLVVLIFWLYRRDRLTSFALFWFLTNLVIESSFIALEIIFEHRMYMPSMFLILAATAWLFRLTANKQAMARTVLIAATVILALFTWQRNSVWKSEISLWTDVLNKAPKSMRAHGNLGNAYSKAYMYPEAERHLLQAVSIGHNDKSGNFSSEYMQKYLAKVHDNLSLVYREMQQYKKAIFEANLALELDPSRPDPLITLGIVYSKMGQHPKAYDYFLTAAMKGAESVDLYNNWAVSSYNLGKIDQSINLLKKSITLDPDHPESHYNLGIAYSSKGMLEEAQREMQMAMKLRNKIKN